MAEFHETRMGMRFFESDLPKLTEALTRIANALNEPRVPSIDAPPTARALEANALRMELQKLIPNIRRTYSENINIMHLVDIAEKLADLTK